jgi:hypothetical protein
MKTLLLAAILGLSACAGWQIAPELSFISGEGDSTTAMHNDPSWGSSSSGDFKAVELKFRAIAPIVLSETDRELVRGIGRGGGNVGVVMGGVERINALTKELGALGADVEKERAAKNALRDQVDHLEGDLRTRTRERDDARTEATDLGVELTKTKIALVEAQDWQESLWKFLDRYGLFGMVVLLFFAWLIVKARYAKKESKPKPATED